MSRVFTDCNFCLLIKKVDIAVGLLYLIVTVGRSRSSVLQCSRCASVISVAASRVNSRPSSQMSLLLDKKFPRGPGGSEKEIQCKICLYDCPQTLMVKLEDCGCAFCREVSLSQGGREGWK